MMMKQKLAAIAATAVLLAAGPLAGSAQAATPAAAPHTWSAAPTPARDIWCAIFPNSRNCPK